MLWVTVLLDSTAVASAALSCPSCGHLPQHAHGAAKDDPSLPGNPDVFLELNCHLLSADAPGVSTDAAKQLVVFYRTVGHNPADAVEEDHHAADAQRIGRFR